MPRTLIGWDSTGTACLKITRDSADNPFLTPDVDRHKFHYNSKDHKVAEIAAVQLPIEENVGSGWVYTGGAGTSADYVSAHRGATGSYFESRFSAAAFPDLDYDCPLVDYKYKDADGKGVDLQYLGGGAGLSSAGGYDVIGARPAQYLAGIAVDEAGDYLGPISTDDQHFVMAGGDTGAHSGAPAALTTLAFMKDSLRDTYFSGSMLAVVWNLPGDNTSLLQAAPATPVPGHKTVEINPTSFRIAKPGFDVASATKQQLAFSATKKPVKVIASGDILIVASATTTHDIGFTVDADVYLDVQYYENGGDIYYPAPPSIALYGAKYYVSGSTLYFENAGAECRARFIVIAVDPLGPSTGSNQPLQEFEEGGEKVVRIVAPGSADPPRLSDIVVDSRWPTMPILAEGYRTVSGIQDFTINFTNPGLKPFVKLAVVRSYTGGKLISQQPLVRRLRRPGYGISGDTVYARVASDTQIVISAFNNKATNAFLSSGGEVRWFMPPVVGVRYYVFGIPE